VRRELKRIKVYEKKQEKAKATEAAAGSGEEVVVGR
jgi:hypothetical protein